MTREEAIWWVNHLFEIRKEEYFNKGIMEDAKEVEEAQHMAIEALECERIKCSHCKHYIRHDHRCGWWNHGVSNVDWCSYGKRREE